MCTSGGSGAEDQQAHLADAVDAEVPAGLALVAGGTIHHGIPQLLSEVFICWSAVQFTRIYWGAQVRETGQEQPGLGFLGPTCPTAPSSPLGGEVGQCRASPSLTTGTHVCSWPL